ncbi:MAG: DoxX family membrane protein [Flavobacteriales bacterium]|nr:DoxX family membrane protein [Flavobacteriales bacterium]
MRLRKLRMTPLLYLRLSIGLCFLWFGALKFVPGLSPAELLAERTIAALTLGLVSGKVALTLLALLEVGLGLALMTGFGVRLALCVLLGHMVCTLSPILIFPHEVFTHVPYGLTLVGQYIIKNFVIMSGAWIVLKSLSEGPAVQGADSRR